MIIIKDIQQLEVGSYVVDITEQNGISKIKSSGLVREQGVIDHLIKQGVLKVRIDTEKSIHADKNVDQNKDNENPVIEPDEDKESVDIIEVEKPKTKPAPKVKNFVKNFVQAKKTFDEAKGLQKKVLADIQKGHTIETEPVKELLKTSIDSIFEDPEALACVINIRIKDEYLLEHSISVSILITIFSRYLKFDKVLASDLAIGAFLHDVGKIKIPDGILNKPGKLTDDEFDIIKSHVVHTKSIIDKATGLAGVSRDIAANHHEKLNGKGYPQGIDHNDLSIYDRMITICDIYDALSADRVYKKGFPQVKCFAILRELATLGDLDTQLVDQFILCLGVYPVGSLVRLKSDKLAIVDAGNAESPTKPNVKAFYNLKENHYIPTEEIDLENNKEEVISQGVRADDFNLNMHEIMDFLVIQS